MNNTKTYRGVVFHFDPIHPQLYTRWTTTWGDAYIHAERLCKKKYGNNGSIKVIDKQGKAC